MPAYQVTYLILWEFLFSLMSLLPIKLPILISWLYCSVVGFDQICWRRHNLVDLNKFSVNFYLQSKIYPIDSYTPFCCKCISFCNLQCVISFLHRGQGTVRASFSCKFLYFFWHFFKQISKWKIYLCIERIKYMST